MIGEKVIDFSLEFENVASKKNVFIDIEKKMNENTSLE